MSAGAQALSCLEIWCVFVLFLNRNLKLWCCLYDFGASWILPCLIDVMMRWSALCVLLLTLLVGGAPKETTSGISQFWTDDHKVFDQIYGKTSDKEIFGATLPPSLAFGADLSRIKNAASEKKERYLEQYQNADLDQDQIDPFAYGAKYAGLLTNQPAKKQTKKNSAKSLTKFIPADFKPIISKESDPETYNYLQHLESLQKKQEQYAPANVGGFKPYLKYAGGYADEAGGYKSIQDILHAHEGNKGKITESSDLDNQVKYLTYGNSKGRSPTKKVKLPLPTKTKVRCPSGRCRKRATTTYRGRTYLTRPILRKIKQKIYY